jgi:hypothetical protein
VSDAIHGLDVRTYAPTPVMLAASPGKAIWIEPPAGMGFVIRNGTATVAFAPLVFGWAVTEPPVSDPPVIEVWTDVTVVDVARTVVPFAAMVLIAPALKVIAPVVVGFTRPASVMVIDVPPSVDRLPAGRSIK